MIYQFHHLKLEIMLKFIISKWISTSQFRKKDQVLHLCFKFHSLKTIQASQDKYKISTWVSPIQLRRKQSKKVDSTWSRNFKNLDSWVLKSHSKVQLQHWSSSQAQVQYPRLTLMLKSKISFQDPQDLLTLPIQKDQVIDHHPGLP